MDAAETYATRYPLHAHAEQGNKGAVQAALAGGSNVSRRDNDGQTCLHKAAASGNTEIAELLIANGADVNAKVPGGLTALHFAALGGHVDVTRLLLEKKAQVNAETNDGVTPLRLAKYTGHTHVAGLLLAKGARLGADKKSAAASAPTMSGEELFNKVSPAVVRVELYDASGRHISSGSGLFVSPDGLLLTNFHVIKGGSSATVRLETNATLPVKGVLAVDPSSDLALLKVDGEGLPYLRIASDQHPSVGTAVHAIGNPQGLTNTLSAGIVSGVRTRDKATWLQTTAATSPGSSGGPLLTGDGLVVGVTTSTYVAGQNLNFAAPAAAVSRLMKNQGTLMAIGSVSGGEWEEAVALACSHSKAGRWSEATTVFKKFIKLHPNHGPAHLNLGLAYHHLGQYREAIAAYNKALSLPLSKAEEAFAYYDVALAYDALNDATTACSCYRWAIESGLDSENRECAQYAQRRITAITTAAADAFAEAEFAAFERKHPDWRKRLEPMRAVHRDLGAIPWEELFELAGIKTANPKRYATICALMRAGSTLAEAKRAVAAAKRAAAAAKCVDLFTNKQTGESFFGKHMGKCETNGKAFMFVRFKDGTTRFLAEDEWTAEIHSR